MRKTKAEALQTREHLMLAALDTFYHKGVAHASLNEIAQNAGVTRGALYWHFKSKEDLFDSLFQRLCDEIAEPLEADLNSGTADMWETMHTSLTNMFDRMENDPIHRKFSNVLHLKCERTEQNQAISTIIDKYENMWHALLDTVLKQCIRQQSLPADLDTTLARLYLKSAIHGLIYQWLVNPDRVNLKENGPRFVQTILSSLKYCPTLRKPQAVV